ncbi:MAG: ATP-binding protein [Planctomycetaceae bacterium]|nr:ATP-binding protein [Planctomycetaceae bacterium]
MAEPVAFETTIPSNTADGLAAQEKIVSLMERWEYSSRDVFAMRLSLEEAVTNAIRHGNRFSEEKVVYIFCEINDQQMKVIVRDQGEGFVPEEIPDPTAAEYIERPNGRGLLLMRAYLSHCEYTEGGRCITMVRERNSELPILDD